MNEQAFRIEQFTYDIIYYVLWFIELVLLLRFVLEIFGANTANSVVAFMYALSSVFMGVFNGVFHTVSMGNMVIDPSVLVAMVFYAIIAYILVALIRVIGQHTVY